MRISWLTGAVVAAGVVLAGSAQADITIGVAGPMTGPNAAFGAQLTHGAQQAADDINKAGGILGGQMIKLEFGDDVSDPKQGVSVGNKFVGDGVMFVDGHFNSGVTIPTAANVYAENGILAITPAATNPCVTDMKIKACPAMQINDPIPSLMMFRTCGRDDQQGAVAGAYIAKNYAGKNVAVLHDKTPYGQGLADETKKAMNAAGMTEVMYDGIDVGTSDFSALISRMKDAKVDVVYFGGLHTEAGKMVRQMADQGLKAQFISGDGIVSEEFAAIAGPAAEGVLNTFGPDPRNNPAAKDIVAEFRAAGFEPEAYTLYSYAVIQVLAQAIDKTGEADPTKVAAMLYNSGPWQTVLGPLSYDDKGDITKLDYVMYVWKKGDDGKITYVEQ